MKSIFSKIISFFKIRDKETFNVTAIVLCYNGQDYIKERLSSIINQSLKPFEIIFLDDASRDESVSIAQEILKKSKIKYRIFINGKNKGYGHQIKKGLDEAKGNYIWIAEQDDYCTTEFLKEMKRLFKKTDVNIAYCQSTPVDKNNNELEYYYHNEKQLNASYCVDGSFEIKNKLSVKNTIYDISAVIFRKSALTGVIPLLDDYKVFYDWILYAYVLQKGKINYSSSSLNFHMRHSNSIIAKKRKNASFYKDLFTIKNYIIDHYTLPKHIMLEMLYEIDRDYRQYGCRGYESRDIKDHPVLSIKYTELQKKIEKCSCQTN